MPFKEGQEQEEILGKITGENAKFDLEHTLEKGERIENYYVDFEHALELVRNNQPFKKDNKTERQDSTNPEEFFPDDLHTKIAEILIDDKMLEDASDLRYYTAVGSHLDVFHKVDCFFEMRKMGKVLRVTLDITIDEAKLPFKRADVPFLWPKDSGNDNDRVDVKQLKNIEKKLDQKQEVSLEDSKYYKENQSVYQQLVNNVAEMVVASFKEKEASTKPKQEKIHCPRLPRITRRYAHA